MKKSTIIVLLAAIGLGAFVYFYEIKGAKEREEAEEKSKQVFQFGSDEMDSLSWTRTGETFAFEKRDEDWIMTQPLSVKADGATLGTIVSNLTTSRVERTFASDQDKLGSYGLAEPQVHLRVKLTNGAQHQLRLGDKDFAGTNIYALIDDDPKVALVPASLLASVDKTLFDLRDKSVMDVDQSDVNSLELKTAAGDYLLGKQGDTWRFQQPDMPPADSTEVSSIVSRLSFARITEVVAEETSDEKTYGFDQPTLSVRLKTEKGDEQTLLLGTKADGDYYGKTSRRSTVFKIGADIYDTLNVTLLKLRDKKPAPIDRDEITRVLIKNEHQTIVCEKTSDEKWLLKEPQDKKDKEVKSYELFNPLTISEAKEIFDRPTEQMMDAVTSPAVEIELTRTDGQTISLSVSGKVGENVYVRNSLSKAVMLFEGKLLDDLNFKLDDILQ